MREEEQILPSKNEVVCFGLKSEKSRVCFYISFLGLP